MDQVEIKNKINHLLHNPSEGEQISVLRINIREVEDSNLTYGAIIGKFGKIKKKL